MKELYRQSIASAGVCTDTHKIVPNSVCFTLKGAPSDGNTFAAEALNKGTALTMIDNPAYQIDERTLLMPDVLLALQGLTNYHRRTLKTLITSIAGGNGKTATKELIKSVLSGAMQVVATEGNLNNIIGVPLTLLSIKPETDITIVEMDANHPHEIADLSRITEPDYGYITSIGKAHLESFGSFEGVIRTKAKLYDYLKAHQKTIIYNADDALQRSLVEGYVSVYNFGTTDEVDVPVACVAVQPMSICFSEGSVLQAEEPTTRGLPYIDTTIKGFSGATIAVSHPMGSYNFNNIAAATAFGRYFGLPTAAIKKGVEKYVPHNNRSQLMAWGTNTLLLDAYNASPGSMAAAIHNVLTMPNLIKRVFILDDMFKLDDYAATEHQQIVDSLTPHQWEGVYSVGQHFAQTKDPYPQYETFEAFQEAFKQLTSTNSLILIKGSRGMTLERLITND